MKESESVRMGEIAEEWGCDIDNEVDFFKHYMEFKTYKVISYVLLGFLIFLNVLVFMI